MSDRQTYQRVSDHLAGATAGAALALVVVVLALLLGSCGDQPNGKVATTQNGNDIVTYCDYAHGNLVYVNTYHDSIAVIKDGNCTHG